MSGNNLWCRKCKSHHHAVERCWSEGVKVETTTQIRVEEAERCINRIQDLLEYGYKNMSVEDLRNRMLLQIDGYAKELKNRIA